MLEYLSQIMQSTCAAVCEHLSSSESCAAKKIPSRDIIFFFSSRTRGKYLNRMKCQISINSVQHPNHNNCSHMHAFFPLEGNYCACRRCKWCFLLEPLSFGPLRDVLQRPLFGSIPVVERPGALFVLLDHCLQWPTRADCAL